ncbi:hypothetical protein LguiA_032875 [Lonicera macranthoides]
MWDFQRGALITYGARGIIDALDLLNGEVLVGRSYRLVYGTIPTHRLLKLRWMLLSRKEVSRTGLEVVAQNSFGSVIFSRSSSVLYCIKLRNAEIGEDLAAASGRFGSLEKEFWFGDFLK